MRKRGIVYTPNLTATLRSLEPGDFVDLGKRWGYGTVRQTASVLGIRIQTKRRAKRIIVLCQQEIPG